jgi:hypothetical protein
VSRPARSSERDIRAPRSIAACGNPKHTSSRKHGEISRVGAERLDNLLRSLLGNVNRRGVTQAGILLAGGVLGQCVLAHADAGKKRKRRKRCKSGSKRCGRGCCGSASRCVVRICFCTGNEGPGAKCTDVATTLIDLIAEVTGIAPDVIGADPDSPLSEQVTIEEDVREAIDKLIEKTFLVAEDVPYYTEGIAAGAAFIEQELASKG